MREIKFRAWDKQRIKMIYPEIENKWIGSEEEYYPIVIPRDEITHGHHIELMQFSGLKDKNGKEIYEGDILRYEYFHPVKSKMIKIGEVVFYKGRAAFAVEYMDGEYDFFGEKIYINTGTVIGNVYENHELLEEHGHEAKEFEL